MTAINFTVFIDKIESGAKRQTIRKTARCKPGDTLQLYTGMRTKKCRLIGLAKCLDVIPVRIANSGFAVDGLGMGAYNGVHGFAHADGFKEWADLRDFFRSKYGLPFEGVIIRWTDFQPAAPLKAEAK